MFRTIDLSEKLRDRKNKKQSVLDIVNKWFREEEVLEKLLFNTPENEVSIDYSILNSEDIFDESHIRQICLEYNLRFLDRELYKDQIPYEAIIKLKKLNQVEKIQFKSFKILAPAKKFKLKDELDDPILFGQIGHREFYMIHKWGNDLAWYKKIAAFPFRNIKCLILSILFVCILLGALVPNSILTSELDSIYFNFPRFIIVFWFFILGASFTLYYWLVSRSEFSEHVWDSKYL